MKNRSQENFNSNEYAEQYKKCKGDYDRLRERLAEAIKMILQEEKIDILQIQHRTKGEKEFLEKIERKEYKKPFEQTEDICGIRIICYYLSDIDKIIEILKPEFEVKKIEDKILNLDPNQFGYRSTHLIVTIKEEWSKTPNYRGLKNLKAEIQIRTVLMHAWAEIEHELVYKNKQQSPPEVRRKLSGISAKLEEADKQFEELRKARINYKEEVTESFNKNEYEGVELNLDSLQAFLDKCLPNRNKNFILTRDLFNNFIIINNVSLSSLDHSVNKVKNYLPKIEEEFDKSFSRPFSQPIFLALIFMIANDKKINLGAYMHKSIPIIQKWREIIAQDEAKKTKKD